MDYYEKLLPILVKLGVATLAEFLGSEKANRYSDMGYPIDASTLSEILLTEQGINILRDKDIRKNILTTFDPDLIKNHFDQNPPKQSMNEICAFKWGENRDTFKFLNLLEISTDCLQSETTTTRPSESIQLDGILYPYQNWIRKEILEFLCNSDKRRVIVHMPTGSGKTRTCMEAICDFIRLQNQTGFAAVWFAHSEELCEQAIESFISLWSKHGSEDANILRLWGGNRFDEVNIDKPTFIVTSFQTAYSMLHTQHDDRFSLFTRIKRHCKLLIVDEAHKSMATTYKDAIELFANNETRTVGLTATPGRHHVGADPEETRSLSKFYDHNMISIVDDDGKPLDDPIDYLTKKGVLSNIERNKLYSNTNIELTSSEKKHIERLLDIPTSVLKRLGEDANRTNIIVTNALKLAITKKCPTIVFAGSKENAIDIATSLRLKNCSARAITGETTTFERRNSIEQYKKGEVKVLTNFGVLTTGFDAPNTKAVIIARPTTSIVLYSQMIGRGLRGPLMGGNETCILVDVIDNLVNMPNVSNAFQFFDEYFK